MSVSDEVDRSWTWRSSEDGDPGPAPRSTARWTALLLLIAITVVAIIAALWWVPGAFASPAGGCGGG